MSAVRRWLEAAPTMLRVGLAETLAYRVEFVVWMLTSTLPLVMLGLWTSVTATAPFAGYSTDDFVAYYLAAMIVRNLTGSWVMWQLNDEIRTGTLSIRLIRPIHPFITYAATHLGATPLRAVVAIPVAVVLYAVAGDAVVIGEPAIWPALLLAMAGAWVLSFFVLVAIGALSLFIERSIAVFNVYLGVFAVTSGYLVPIDLLPPWAADLCDWLPFRYMLSLPVEILLGAHTPAAALGLAMVGWLYAALLCAVALFIWRAGLRRYEAFGT